MATGEASKRGEAIEARLREALERGGFSLSRVGRRQEPAEVFEIELADLGLTIWLSPRDDARAAYQRTPWLDVGYQGEELSPEADEALQGIMDSLDDDLGEAMAGWLRSAAPPASAPASDDGPAPAEEPSSPEDEAASEVTDQPEIRARLVSLMELDAGLAGSSVTAAGIQGRAVALRIEGEGEGFTAWLSLAGMSGRGAVRVGRFDLGYRRTVMTPAKEAAFDALRAHTRAAEERLADELFDASGPIRFDLMLTEPRHLERLALEGDEVYLRVLLTCNERCPFCSTDSASPNVIRAPALVPAAIRRCAKLGARRLHFTGGEPTLAPELPEWVALAKGLGLQVLIQTNGVPMARPGFWERFTNAGGETVLPDELFVSLHTQHPDRLPSLTGVGGTFDHKLRAIRSALSRGIRVTLNMVISTLNLNEVPAFPSFVAKTFGTRPGLVFSFVATAGRALQDRTLIPRMATVTPGLHEALRSAERLGFEWIVIPDICGVPPCVMPGDERFFECLIRPDPGKRLGGLPSWRHKPDHCLECRHDRLCSGFWTGYVERYGDDELRPVP
jgi:pyruvate-formate lyase-activating enzyme